ncbi:MAG: hypothetical protein QOJ51_5705 [Acidobacteriaceae bacterium]|jgi:hypothetical protein|nr:hypothetical protein [Acidobacteriaceae bacterium]
MLYFAALNRTIHSRGPVAGSGENQRKLIVQYKRKNRTVLEASWRPVGLSGYIVKASIGKRPKTRTSPQNDSFNASCKIRGSNADVIWPVDDVPRKFCG